MFDPDCPPDVVPAAGAACVPGSGGGGVVPPPTVCVAVELCDPVSCAPVTVLMCSTDNGVSWTARGVVTGSGVNPVVPAGLVDCAPTPCPTRPVAPGA